MSTENNTNNKSRDKGIKFSLDRLVDVVKNPEYASQIDICCGCHTTGKWSSNTVNDLWLGSYPNWSTPYAVLATRADGTPKPCSDILDINKPQSNRYGDLRMVIREGDILMVAIRDVQHSYVVTLVIDSFTKTVNPAVDTAHCSVIQTECYREFGIGKIYNHLGDEHALAGLPRWVYDTLSELTQTASYTVPDWHEYYIHRMADLPYQMVPYAGTDDDTVPSSNRTVSNDEFYHLLGKYCNEYHYKTKVSGKPLQAFFYRRTPVEFTCNVVSILEQAELDVTSPYQVLEVTVKIPYVGCLTTTMTMQEYLKHMSFPHHSTFGHIQSSDRGQYTWVSYLYV